MREDSITLALFEKYSAEEMTATAQKMAQAQSDLESVEGEKKVSDAAYNERIKKFGAEVSELAKRYNKGGETAQIGCDIRYDHPEPGRKSYFRMDRAELVETHDMSWEEKQDTLQFPLATSAEAPTAEPQPSEAHVDAVLDSLAPDDEVTRLCPFPNCALFVNHDGDHEFAVTGKKPDAEASVEERQRTRKARKKAPITPPPDDPNAGAGSIQP